MSPAVAFTSKIPPEMSRIETSNVPPPMSKIKMCRSSSLFLSSPYATAAAVGSFIILMTSKPAMAPASFVACLEKCVLKIAHDLMIYRSVLLSRNFACDAMKSMLRAKMDFIHRAITVTSLKRHISRLEVRGFGTLICRIAEKC